MLPEDSLTKKLARKLCQIFTTASVGTNQTNPLSAEFSPKSKQQSLGSPPIFLDLVGNTRKPAEAANEHQPS
jgi:hypothetical protein